MTSNVLGIATDIVFMPRISYLLKRFPPNSSSLRKLTLKFMHPYEINQLQLLIDQKNDPTTYLAGIWATKECIWKALSSFVDPKIMPPAATIYRGLCYKTRGFSEAPLLMFDPDFPLISPSHSRFYEEYIHKKNTSALLSLSHDKDYLVAFLTLLEGIN